MTTSSHPPDLASMTIRELLAELARLEDRLNACRADPGSRPTRETAEIERRMSAISACLRDVRARMTVTGPP